MMSIGSFQSLIGKLDAASARLKASTPSRRARR
jgi:hypothetical protein